MMRQTCRPISHFWLSGSARNQRRKTISTALGRIHATPTIAPPAGLSRAGTFPRHTQDMSAPKARKAAPMISPLRADAPLKT